MAVDKDPTPTLQKDYFNCYSFYQCYTVIEYKLGIFSSFIHYVILMYMKLVTIMTHLCV